MTQTVLTIDKLAGCGAMVKGVDLASVDSVTAAALKNALFEHGVLFFRGQSLDRQAHLDLARRFAPIDINRFFPTDPDWPEIAKVEKAPEQTTNIGGGWHTDHSYDAEPALGSILVARDLPASGGDTLFADMYAAYEALSPDMKSRLKDLRAVHGSAHVFGAGGAYTNTDQQALSGSRETPETLHPVIIRHPGSGRPALYVNPAFTMRIEGWTSRESRPLLDFLFEHSRQERFTCRFAWRDGSVAFWDNRQVWHYALNDYPGQRRHMRRVTVDAG